MATVQRSKRKKPMRRPRKSEALKRRRAKLHRKRLVALGLPEEKVAKLNSKEMRSLLLRPKKLQAS